MKKLSKEQVKRRDEIVHLIEEEYDQLEQAIGRYNAALVSASEFTQEVASEIEDYVSERSEKWQEGDQGAVYEDWRSAWADWDPEEFLAPDPQHEELEALPEEPS